jgi:hypothetical protein
MRREGICGPGTRLPETEPLQRAAQHVAQSGQLLKADLLTGNYLGLQGLDLNRQRCGLPDENLAWLAVLAAEIIRESDCDVAIAPSDYAAAIDATKH